MTNNYEYDRWMADCNMKGYLNITNLVHTILVAMCYAYSRYLYISYSTGYSRLYMDLGILSISYYTAYFKSYIIHILYVYISQDIIMHISLVVVDEDVF